MKIYTRTGDDGSTGLLGPGRVSKSDPRVEAYGTVDELNAALGLVRAADTEGWVAPRVAMVQDRLFALGATLATTSAELRSQLDHVSDEDVTALERAIDELEEGLTPLRRFVLPGGSPLAAQLHVARTVCRRAERRVVAVAGGDARDAAALRFLNRLADLLFVMARWCNRQAGVAESPWQSGPGP